MLRRHYHFSFSFLLPTLSFLVARIPFLNRLTPGSLVLLFYLFLLPGFLFLTDFRRDHWSYFYSLWWQSGLIRYFINFCSQPLFTLLVVYFLSVTFDEWYAPHLPNFPHMALVDPRNMVTALSQEHPALGLNPRPLGYETDALTTRPRCFRLTHSPIDKRNNESDNE